ncbi:hypothetical protein [Novosphingobium rosa]|uniref:hypothetical protein n=1 Tax=Novosphingobium rosa TaxID=76978 RepID=UPI00082A82A0|nr:hypothetical protein [Novosphingobium rosa]
MNAPIFTHYAAVDWSGASGERHKGIAVAIIGAGDRMPMLVRPGHIWSRMEVLEWLLETPPHTLIGFDLGQSLAHADRGAFFPGWQDSPDTARELWALVEAICAREPHLGVSTFVDHPQASRYFRRHGLREGDLFGAEGQPGGRGRMRVTEHAQALAGCRPTSNFNLVGAGQVGKGSLSGMRLFHRLPREVTVWPMDPLPQQGRVVVEIYTTLAAMAAGRSAGRSKVRNRGDLAVALAALGCQPEVVEEAAAPIADHAADALMTAAWLRGHAGREDLWRPSALTGKIALTEGWTFGVA